MNLCLNDIQEYAKDFSKFDKLYQDYCVLCDKLSHELESLIVAHFDEEDGWDVFFYGKYIEVSKNDWKKPNSKAFVELSFLDGADFYKLALQKVKVQFLAYAGQNIQSSLRTVEYDFADDKSNACLGIARQLIDCVQDYTPQIERFVADINKKH